MYNNSIKRRKRKKHNKNKNKNIIISITALLVFLLIFAFASTYDNGKNEPGNLQSTDGTGESETDEPINIVEVLPQSISFADTPTELVEGEIINVNALIEPKEATDQTINYSCDDESIAIIDKKGNIAALKAGTVTITAKTVNNKIAACTITIKEISIELKIITLEFQETTLNVGANHKITYIATPTNADNTTVSWTSSDNEIASVDSDGTVSGISEGTVILTVTAFNGVTASCTVKLVAAQPSEITLNKTSLTMTEGETQTLTATITPSETADKEITWLSSDTAVATVSDGKVTAKSEGTAEITVVTFDGKTATCIITVNSAANEETVTLQALPLKRDVPNDADASYNTPKCSLDDIVEGNFPIKNVLVGKDGWMFYGDDENQISNNTIKDFKGVNLFTEAQLASITANFVNQANWLEGQGIKYYITIAPNKNAIYSEYMPDNVTKGETHRMDQLIDYIHKNTNLTVIDYRDELLASKALNPNEPLYYKLDTHWTNNGGFIAYKKIVETIKKDFPNIPVMSKQDYQIDYLPSYMKDMPWYLGYYDSFDENGPVYTKLKNTTAKLAEIDTSKTYTGVWFHTNTYPNGYHDMNWFCRFTNEAISDAPKVYFIRDSFSIATINFLKESFSECSFRWTTDFTKSQVLRDTPDIVVFEIVERLLGDLINKNVFNG